VIYLQDKFSALIKNAVLEILEFDIHRYPPMNTMNVVGRVTPYYIMSYIKQGLARIKFNGETFITEPGTVVIFPPGIPHDHIRISEEPAEFLWWNFNFKIAESIDVLKLLDLPVIFKISNGSAFEKVFCEYIELTHRQVSISNIILKKAKELEVMAVLMDNITELNKSYSSDDFNESFREILAEILQTPESIGSLKLLAEKYHMHPTYISNKFKDHFGISPILLQREVIYEKAKVLLKSENMSIGQIAQVLGFSDISVFSRFFTAKSGMSPLQYRGQNSGKLYSTKFKEEHWRKYE
jgi:AraC family transcriptional regulator, arabinose operon regulatory protein